MIYRLVRALLFLLPAEAAHRFAAAGLRWLGRRPRLRARMRARRAAPELDLSVTVAGVRFPNPIVLAAGFDKDAEMVEGLFALGFGGVEVGTVTPRAQPGNPKPRLFRAPAHRALINRMGFNNDGAEAMARRLGALSWRPAPVGVNLGRNKDTPNERAGDDYVLCAKALGALADYVVVNASSPNTPGLRELQEPQTLRELLTHVRRALDARAPGKPLFVKVAPDLTDDALRAAVDVTVEAGAQGLIATNTTLARPFGGAVAQEAGGLSGAPLRERATQCVQLAVRHASGRIAVLGAGGVFTADDAYEKLRAGARLIQVYTGFIYEGPFMVRRLLAGLAARMRRDGVRSLAQL